MKRDAGVLTTVSASMSGYVGSTFESTSKDVHGNVWGFVCRPDEASGAVNLDVSRVDVTSGTLNVQIALKHVSGNAFLNTNVAGSLVGTSALLKVTDMPTLMDPMSGYVDSNSGKFTLEVFVWESTALDHSSKRFKASGSETSSNAADEDEDLIGDDIFIATLEDALPPVQENIVVIDEDEQNKGLLKMDLSYDSKQATGMVGLKNQGATCYMNSLLQTLFHLAQFRKAVYDTPTSKDDSNDSVVLALQRVFYRLETSQKAVSTKELTRSFGWSHMDAFTQHDVQELYRILCDRLEEKMKGTPADGLIKQMFEGKVKSFISCVNVPCESSRLESFYDLQLDVKGLQNLDSSFQKYIEVEMLDGENQYDAKDYGKQDAKKGLAFESLPPILNIQLKRFEYDPLRDGMVKIHDRFEFPVRLDLSQYVPNTSEAPSSIYQLHSILVHSGDVHGGHYYVYVRPRLDKDWYKFDDDMITSADETALLEGSYGQPRTPVHPTTSLGRVLSCSSAYMLVYLREDACPSITEPVVIPHALQERFQAEETAEIRRKRQKMREESFCHLRIATDETLEKFQKITRQNDLCSLPKGIKFNSNSTIIRLKIQRSWTVRQLYALLHIKTGIPINGMRLWKFAFRQNKTTRPDELLDAWLDSSLQLVYADEVEIHSSKPIPLFLEIVLPDFPILKKVNWSDFNPIPYEEINAAPEVDDDGIELIPAGLITLVEEAAAERGSMMPPKDSILIFVKFYDTSRPLGERLVYVGNMILPSTNTAEDVIQIIQEHAFDKLLEEEIDLYEQVQPEAINKLDLTLTLAESDIQTGDIVVFQFPPEEDNVDEDYATVPDYFTYLLDRVDVTFIPRFEDDAPFTTFILHLFFSDSYDTVVAAVANSLKMDPLHIRLYQHNTLENAPKSNAIRHSKSSGASGVCLKNLLFTDRNEKQVAKLYYERLDDSIIEIERKKNLPLRLSPHVSAFKIDVIDRIDLHLEPTSTVESALAEIVRRHDIDIRVLELRLLETRDISMLLREVPGITPVTHLLSHSAYIVDAIPKAVRALTMHSVVGVMHFSYSHDAFISAHHIPGLIVIDDNDTFQSLRSKIQAKFNVSDEVIAKWKLAIIVDNKATPLETIPGDLDSELVYDKLPIGDGRWFLGVEYHGTTKGETRRKDNGIKIRSN
ncbi:ubiquitin carboxyl-terminal hydrolase 5 [Thraustotheca clavata]|uniref:ubiquitinyl hydrolase 1 n=1 Tax=Thraustotheca clavata TaxID=74557 RepID=A0A1V9YSG3_9STRA|nr:ubiquitin carboxyl-terminal hydrolase 5 [Thraustotheca clavata]